MLESVRARLAMWHTIVLGVLLSVFALAAYVFLQNTTARRAQEYLDSSAAAFAQELGTEREDASSDSAAISAAIAEFHVRDLAVAVFDTNGRAIGINSSVIPAAGTGSVLRPASDAEPDHALHTADLESAMRRIGAVTHTVDVTVPDAEGGYRASVTPVRFGAHRYRVVMIQSRHAEAETLQEARMAYLVAIPLMLVAAAFGGSLLAKHSLAPVAEMSRHAARISAANLDDRLPVANSRDELGQLGTVLNALLARVHTAFIQQRRFMADASHELRTPVSIIRAESEVALGSDIRSPKEYRESLGVVRDASARLSLIVNELFLLARADAGEQPFTFSTLYLDELVDDCARSVRALAVRSHVDLHVVTHDVDVAFEGDDEMLRRLVTNLLENAVKYSREGAEVTITLSKAPGGYRLSVRDTGEGIAPEAQPHVFERFFRADTARSHQLHGAQSSGSGAGLGLAIARWIAEAHGGTLNLVASSPAGSEFVLWLPASPAGEEPATNQKD